MLKYNFHDSLIEDVNYIPNEAKLEIKIKLCNWMQSDYKDSDPEMLTMHMIFDGVEKFEMSTENYVFNSNEILDVIELDDRTVKIIFLTENDVKTIIVTAERVDYAIYENEQS